MCIDCKKMMKMETMVSISCLLLYLNGVMALVFMEKDVAVVRSSYTIKCLFNQTLPTWVMKFDDDSVTIANSGSSEINPNFSAKERIAYDINQQDLRLSNVSLTDAGTYVCSYARSNDRKASYLTLTVDDFMILDKKHPEGDHGIFYVSTGCITPDEVTVEWMYILPNDDMVEIKNTTSSYLNSTGCTETQDNLTTWFPYSSSNHTRRVLVSVMVRLKHTSNSSGSTISHMFSSNKFYIDGCCAGPFISSIFAIVVIAISFFIFAFIWIKSLDKKKKEKKQRTIILIMEFVLFALSMGLSISVLVDPQYPQNYLDCHCVSHIIMAVFQWVSFTVGCAILLCVKKCSSQERSKREKDKLPLIKEYYEEQKSVFKDTLKQKYKRDYDNQGRKNNIYDEYWNIIDTVYVYPRMTLDDHETGSIGGRQGTWSIQRCHRADNIPIQQNIQVLLPDLFSDGQRNFSKIFIAGDAGYGKTALCHMMILAWIEGTDGEKMNDYIPSDFVEAMKQFEFLFYISLRSYTHTSSVSKMIKEHYFVYKPFYDSFILNENSCLIILDGLDEWESPEEHESAMNPISGFLDLEIVKKYTILTTSRNWKLEKLRLGSPYMDRKILLNEFTKDNVMALMKIFQNQENIDEEGLKAMIFDSRLASILKVPILIKWFVVLWGKNKDLKQINSQFHLYIDIIDNMLNDLYNIQKKKKTENEESGANLLSCFENKVYCKHFSNILMSLSILAFKLWYKGQIVFSHTDADVEGLREKDITSCLNMGLLCQDIYGPERNDKKILTFLHKSFQDFFTALYIIMNAEKENMTDVYIKLWKNRDRPVFIFMSSFDSEIMIDAFNEVLIYLKKEQADLNTMDEITPLPESGNFFELQELLCDCVQTSMEQNKPIKCKIE